MNTETKKILIAVFATLLGAALIFTLLKVFFVFIIDHWFISLLLAAIAAGVTLFLAGQKKL